MKNKSRLFVSMVLVLVILHALTILFSWIISAVYPVLGIKSLLGNEGLRWLLYSVADNLSSHILVWILMCGMVVGMFKINNFPQRFFAFSDEDPRGKFAMKIFFLENFVGFLVCIILAFWPHSLALGVSGHLLPGPFLTMIVNIMATTFVVSNISFMLLCGNAYNYEKTEKALIFGIQKVAPLIVIYFLLKEWVAMLMFVL